ncbi:hypothetical protein ISS07_05390 [Candidatus Woesearchaeota archaeon]|nr:hypothetical protein [Candidatus Woesearchaeota archaeon]
MEYDGATGFRKGIIAKLTNDAIIPLLTSELRLNSEYGELVREVNPLKFMDSVRNYLSSHDITVSKKRKKDGLELILGEKPEPEQTRVDQANRVLYLANKILLTTRETQVPSRDFMEAEKGPQDYLDSMLGAMNPLSGEEIIQYGDRMSRLLTLDSARNFVPTALNGFNALSQWYQSEEDKVKKGKDGSYKDLDSLKADYKGMLTQMLDLVIDYSKEKGSFGLNQSGKARFSTELIEKMADVVKEKGGS